MDGAILLPFPKVFLVLVAIMRRQTVTAYLGLSVRDMQTLIQIICLSQTFAVNCSLKAKNDPKEFNLLQGKESKFKISCNNSMEPVFIAVPSGRTF